jgi:hypothetical protein
MESVVETAFDDGDECDVLEGEGRRVRPATNGRMPM